MSIRELIAEKARELAGEAEVGFMHLHAAASHLAAELRRELDSLIVEVRPAGSAVVSTPVIASVLPEPESAPPAAVSMTAGTAADEPAAAASSATESVQQDPAS